MPLIVLLELLIVLSVLLIVLFCVFTSASFDAFWLLDALLFPLTLLVRLQSNMPRGTCCRAGCHAECAWKRPFFGCTPLKPAALTDRASVSPSAAGTRVD